MVFGKSMVGHDDVQCTRKPWKQWHWQLKKKIYKSMNWDYVTYWYRYLYGTPSSIELLSVDGGSIFIIHLKKLSCGNLLHLIYSINSVWMCFINFTCQNICGKSPPLWILLLLLLHRNFPLPSNWEQIFVALIDEDLSPFHSPK